MDWKDFTGIGLYIVTDFNFLLHGQRETHHVNRMRIWDSLPIDIMKVIALEGK